MRLLGKNTYFHRVKTNIICHLLIVAMVSGLFTFLRPVEIYGYTEKTGKVVNINQGSVLNVRSGPGTSYSIVSSLVNDTVVTIIGEEYATDGSKWYQINYFSGSYLKTGYVHSGYIEITGDIVYEPDADFEAYLTAQGFPDSYKDGLRLLHAKYPNWIFKADIINVDFNTAVDNEYKINPYSDTNYAMGRSLIENTSISSWKSTDPKAYDWSTGKWYGFDGANWVAASRELVAYALDPRNFLQENYIFQFESLSYDSTYHTKEGLQSMVKNTFLSGDISDDNGGTISYVDALIKIAEETGCSPIYLAAVITLEQGSAGTNGSVSGTYPGYEGYYNYYHIGAYSAGGKSAVENGLIYAKNKGWNTRYKALYEGAKWIASSYINVGQDTLYYKKFDFIEPLYTHQYMTDIIGARQQGALASKGYTDEIKNTVPMVFKIPVFTNMPDTACPIPTKDGSPNNVLKSLSVAESGITPSFSMFTSNYDVIVNYEVSSITVQAQAVDSKAVITGAGTHQLSVGNNQIVVYVKAENGDVREYKLSVVRKASDVEFNVSVGDVNANDDAGTVSKIEPGTTVDTLRSKFTVQGGSVKITDASGKEKTGTIGTGDKVIIYKGDGTLYKEYTVVVYGDVNGDGIITVKDALAMRKHILGMSSLSGCYANAADVAGESGISVKDALAVRKHILGMENLVQK